MANDGDPYLVFTQMSFDSKDILDRYLEAVQKVVDRHDILRTAIMWDNLSVPAQVVLRHAPMSVTELSLNHANGPIVEQMAKTFDPSIYRIDLTQAPLIGFAIAQDVDDHWIAVKLMHHLIGDNSTDEVMTTEVKALFNGQISLLHAPLPFRNLIAQTRSGSGTETNEHFFTKMLDGIDSPVLPYGLSNAYLNSADISESHRVLSQDLNNRLRSHSKKMGVSLASLCHLAWAQLISRTSGKEQVVFGTVLFGRMQGGSGADQAMGLFINTLPICIDVGGNSVEESVRQTQSSLAALLEHEHASLAIAQRCSSIPAGTPLFSSILNYRHHSVQANGNSSIDGIEVLDGKMCSSYPFEMSFDDFETDLSLSAQTVYPIDAFNVCEYLEQALLSLVDALDHSPNMSARALEIMPACEREMLIRSWNNTDTTYPFHLGIHQLFEKQVEQSPDAIAIVFEDQSLTYRELNARSNSLAHHLISLGVKPDSLVAICVSRSPVMIIALLAVLKSGGAYVPLDPSFASERLQSILVDASPSILLADDSGALALGPSLSDALSVIDPNMLLRESYDNPRVPGLTPHHLAYVIYTSGSTGKPKGVMIEHQGVTNLAMSRPSIFGVNSSSKVLQFSSFSFDGSVHDIFSALSHGGSLHILSDRTRLDRTQLWRYLEEHSITHALLTPALLQDCKDMLPLSTSLTIMLGGEALPASLLKALRLIVPNGSIINDYGPTEATVDALSWRCSNDFNGDMAPIGRPHANKKVYILDTHKKPVPVGVVGELYIAGVGIARGYLNRPDLTDKAFFPDPFSGEKESRMYKTGDMARYLPDGNMTFMGRDDHQVKIRGFRIELGEIETRLSEHPMVREAVVLALGEGVSKRLVAYVVAEDSERLVHSLREHLVPKLPDYMVPAAFVRMDKLPLTSTGKLDRKAFPEPGGDAFVSQGYEAPQGDIELSLALIWSELLKIDRVGRYDNFFTLGGHSLIAVKLTGKIKSQFGIDLRLQTLFRAPTIAQLSPYICQKSNDSQEGAFNVLLPLKPQGNRLPLFCIHPVFGLSWSFIGLSKHLHSEQPIYALQSRGINGNEQVAGSIEEMVWDYIDQILQIQPQGPYHLLGWSFGGSIAHSMAVQLNNLGEEVALLALMDSTSDYSKLSEVELDGDLYAEHLARSSDKSTAEEGMALWERAQNSIRNNMKLARQFSPSVYGGNMLFFSATSSTPVLDPSCWESFTLGGIELCEIGCEHLEMDKAEPMAKIGRVLAVKLEESNQIQTQKSRAQGI
ncbi:hypothetical protein BGZ79_010664 [Entomortierella chlamydospora]|nr:hypothetical protein BGZ79_010664 [Entomortierella chlamydospora]